MEQLRQLGEAVGGINALMAFEPELRVNPRQCRLLADACAHALAAVTGEVRAHLRFEERGAKWRAVEPALRELHRAFRDAEGYVRHCLDPRGGGSWWARAAAAAHGTECVEQHLHGILWCVAVAVEAVEAAAEPSFPWRRRRHLHLVRAGGSRASGEPRQAHREGGRVQLRDDLLRTADGQGPVRGQPPAGRQDEQEHPRRRAAAVPVPGAQVPGRPDQAVLARRPGATPAVRLCLPRPPVREAVPGHEPGAATGPAGRRAASRAGR